MCVCGSRRANHERRSARRRFLATWSSVAAERISNPIAVFSGLDKITGLTTTFEAKIGEEKRFGGLFIKADACYTRDVTEEPRTTSFVEVGGDRVRRFAQEDFLRLDVRRKSGPERGGASDL